MVRILFVCHGTTFPHNLTEESEIRAGVCRLAEQVCARLRRHGMRGSVVDVHIRRPDMTDISRQTSLPQPTDLQSEVQQYAMKLISANWTSGDPIRAITIGVSKLVSSDAPEQLSMFDNVSREKQSKLQDAVDALREKHGNIISLGWRKQ